MSSTHTSGPSHGSGRVKIKKEPGSGPNHKMEGDGKERPYMCDKCPKAYARRDYLERHLLNRKSFLPYFWRSLLDDANEKERWEAISHKRARLLEG
jgi:hypothetical protein